MKKNLTFAMLVICGTLTVQQAKAQAHDDEDETTQQSVNSGMRDLTKTVTNSVISTIAAPFLKKTNDVAEQTESQSSSSNSSSQPAPAPSSSPDDDNRRK